MNRCIRFFVLYTVITAAFITGAQGVRADVDTVPVQVAAQAPTETLFVTFDDGSQDHRIPVITANLLGDKLEIEQASLANRTYSYFDNGTGKLWYYPLSGFVRWRADTYDGWKTCQGMDKIDELEGNELDDAADVAIEFLVSSGLVVLTNDEEIVFSRKRTRMIGSMEVETGATTKKPMTVLLLFERTYMGQGFTGGGSRAKVHLGCGGEIVGADVMWRPIVGTGEIPIDSEEMIQAKWEWAVAAAGNGNLELLSADWPAAETRWLARGRLKRQSRALPHDVVPVEFQDYGSLATDDAPPAEIVPYAIPVCIGDDSIVDEGILSISEVPWEPPPATASGIEIVPAAGTTEVTDF